MAGYFCPERLSSETTVWLDKDSEGKGGGGEIEERKKENDSKKYTTWLSTVAAL